MLSHRSGGNPMSDPHLKEIRKVTPSAEGCEDCLKMGGEWVHLRLCLTCGHVGCCDDSPNKHATAHFHQTRHPVIKSYEPQEAWAWCFIDEVDVGDIHAFPDEVAARHYAAPSR